MKESIYKYTIYLEVLGEIAYGKPFDTMEEALKAKHELQDLADKNHFNIKYKILPVDVSCSTRDD